MQEKLKLVLNNKIYQNQKKLDQKKEPSISEESYTSSGIARKKNPSYARYIKELLDTREDFKKDKKRTFGNAVSNRVTDKLKKITK